jgi:hypothetical protein
MHMQYDLKFVRVRRMEIKNKNADSAFCIFTTALVISCQDAVDFGENR